MRAGQLRIIVTGLVGLYPLGGVAYDYFQYLLGLARLGHDVYYHEDSWTWPYHPLERRVTEDGSYSATFIHTYLETYAPDLADKWHYLHLHETSYGMNRAAFDEVARTADLFLNISGVSQIPAALSPRCVKVFVDTDPGYNQIMLTERCSWAANVDRWCDDVRAHDRFLTYAEHIHDADCLVPTVDLPWRTTRPSAVPSQWPEPMPPAANGGVGWSTVMTWNGFKGKLEYQGVEYKSKDGEFERVITMPRRVAVPLTIAAGGGAPMERLASHGWHVVDAPNTTLTAEDYQRFLQRSRGEFSIAKHVYVALRTGWFSCRSVCYLAAGRPVVVQDTGFSAHVPVGEGLMAFTTLDEAVDAIECVEAHYERHAKAARAVAEEYFHSDRVLQRLLDDI